MSFFYQLLVEHKPLLTEMQLYVYRGCYKIIRQPPTMSMIFSRIFHSIDPNDSLRSSPRHGMLYTKGMLIRR